MCWLGIGEFCCFQSMNHEDLSHDHLILYNYSGFSRVFKFVSYGTLRSEILYMLGERLDHVLFIK